MSWLMLEYVCPWCGARFESLEPRANPATSLPHCGGKAKRAVSAVKFKPHYGAVTTGKNDAPPQHALDTRPMADGVNMYEWRKASRAKRREVIKRYGES